MHIIYIDDSRDEQLCIFSALVIRADRWGRAFGAVKSFRRELRAQYGIYVQKELHAWKFVSGRGRPSDEIVPKGARCSIFRDALQTVAGLPDARLFNACFSHKEDEKAFEWLLNRINRTMLAWDSRAILVRDEGKEKQYTRLSRRMHVYNPIPSQYGAWTDTGSSSKNITIDRIIEDPFFKDSAQSYFVQMADFCAYALLRKERPIESKSRYGLHNAFDSLAPILVREACSYDPNGIIRARK